MSPLLTFLVTVLISNGFRLPMDFPGIRHIHELDWGCRSGTADWKRGSMSHTKIPDTLKTWWSSSYQLVFTCALLTAFAAVPLHAQFFQDLYDFNCSTGGCFPNGSLTQGGDGNLYGTTGTSNVGAYGNGSIFKVTPSAPAVVTYLWQFDGATTGLHPAAGLTLASDGNFYGTTFQGGTFGYGTVFRFNPKTDTVTALHSFDSVDDGEPQSPPTQAKDGNLYGMSGNSEFGRPYRVTIPSGKFTAFSTTAPGLGGHLYLASDGNLYGTTFSGGTSGSGTVFSMTTGGAIHTIYEFTGGTDGAGPGPLTEGSDGKLYGTTGDGGGSADAGTIFKMTLCSTTLCATETTLHVFNPTTDGGKPFAGLLLSSNGAFYGTTTEDGADGYGTLFEITYGGIFSKLVDFTGETGTAPGQFADTALLQHTNGSFYGLTFYGGSDGGGNFYSFTPLNPLISLIIEGPVWVKPGEAVEILGNDLNLVSSLTFAGVSAQFQPGSDTYLIATVPSAALDGPIIATLVTGQQIESQGNVHILPVITNLDPSAGPVGTQVGIAGGGFARAKKVTFGGVKATSFTVVNPTLVQAIVPAGAKTGKVGVTTPNGTATSKEMFTVN